MPFKNRILFCIVIGLALSSCSDQSSDAPTDEMPEEELPELSEIILDEEMTVNPSGIAPLTALLDLELDMPVKVDLYMEGKNGLASDVSHSFEETGMNVSLPILGLYPDNSNQVELTFYTLENQVIGSKVYEIQTDPLNDDLPFITINEINLSQLDDKWTFVSYYGNSGELLPNHPFIFDAFNDIRWFLDFRNHPQLSQLFYGDGMERLENGNFYFGFWEFGDVESDHANKIYEMNMFGEILNTWDMPGYKFHHEVVEKPNGNFLVTVDKEGEPTVEDYIIEIDRNSGDIINEWDLNQSLDNTRDAMTDDEEDWFHANAVVYDESDNTILVSGRTQGLIKLTENNEVVWIMGPHRGWGTNANGTDLTQFLLQPLDAGGDPIEDPDVLDGAENHLDFEWNWYQHAPLIMPNENIMLFDNGDNRNFTGKGPYSRAVEFKIDEMNMTIQQIWAYGKSRGTETYARVVSDVDYLEEQNQVVFSPGSINNGVPLGKSIVIDYDSKNVVFEATIESPAPIFAALHRTERLSLYPEQE